MSLPLKDAFAQCERHASRMNRAEARIPFPLDGAALTQDNEDLITLIDQFVLRYTKLQDTLGEQVLRQFCVEVLQELLEDSAFGDVLQCLDRRGYLLANDWRMQRVMRNALTHEYPEQAAWQAETLNKAREMGAQLTQLLTRLTHEFEAHQHT